MAHFIQHLLKDMLGGAMSKVLVLIVSFIALQSTTVFARTSDFCCMADCYEIALCVSTGCYGCLTQALQTKK